MRDDVIFDFVKSFPFVKDNLCSQRAHVYQTLQRLKRIGEGEAFVEAGVFKGEVSRCIAAFFKTFGYNNPIYLYDTFEGMLPEDATEFDWKFKHGEDIGKQLVKDSLQHHATFGRGTTWVRGGLEEVKANVLSSGYENCFFIKGPVQETLLDKSNLPEKIYFVWLDVDWYRPSLAALEGFYPRLVKGGHLFLENINTWKGEREAYDFLRANGFLKEEYDQDTQILIKR